MATSPLHANFLAALARMRVLQEIAQRRLRQEFPNASEEERQVFTEDLAKASECVARLERLVKDTFHLGEFYEPPLEVNDLLDKFEKAVGHTTPNPFSIPSEADGFLKDIKRVLATRRSSE